MIDEEIMDKISEIRNRTQRYISIDIELTAFPSGDNETEYRLTMQRIKNLKYSTFKTRESLINHLDKLLEK